MNADLTIHVTSDMPTCAQEEEGLGVEPLACEQVISGRPAPPLEPQLFSEVVLKLVDHHPQFFQLWRAQVPTLLCNGLWDSGVTFFLISHH